MRITRQTHPFKNACTALVNLIEILNLNISNSTLSQIEQHPDYPSLSSMSETLTDWKIENLAVKSSIEQLKEIPYPSIAHLDKNNGHFVVLQELKDDVLTYIDPEIGLVKESLNNFEKKWTGVLLLVQPNEKSGEEGYALKRRFEIIEQAKKISIIVSGSLLLLTTGFLGSLSLLSLLILKITGGGLCFLLLQEQFGNTNYSKAICHLVRVQIAMP